MSPNFIREALILALQRAQPANQRIKQLIMRAPWDWIGNPPFPNSSALNRPLSYGYHLMFISCTIAVDGRDYEEGEYEAVQAKLGRW